MTAINFRFIAATLRLRAWSVYGDPKDEVNPTKNISEAIWKLAKEFDEVAYFEEHPITVVAREIPKPQMLGDMLVSDVDKLTAKP